MKRILLIVSALFFSFSLASAQTDYVAGKTAPQLKTFLTLSNVENTALSTWAGTSNVTTLGTLTTGTWNGSKISEAYGGTNQSTYTTGDVLYASASNTLSKLAIGSTGQYLKVASGIPSWASISVYTYSTITADQTATVANFYWTNKTSTRDVVTLPSSATIGDRIAIVNDPTLNTGWKLAQPATTKIYWGSAATTAGTGGYIQSTAAGDAIEVVYQKNDGTNNLWYVVSAQGQLTVN